MLHRVMIKATPLHDVAGRVDYISNPDRQEHLVYADENCADTEFWKRLSEHCQAMAPGKKACEGREFILPCLIGCMKKCMQTMLQNDFSELLMRKPARKAQLQSIGTERETRITCILFAVKTKSCQSRSR